MVVMTVLSFSRTLEEQTKMQLFQDTINSKK